MGSDAGSKDGIGAAGDGTKINGRCSLDVALVAGSGAFKPEASVAPTRTDGSGDSGGGGA